MPAFSLDGSNRQVDIGQGFTIRAPGITADGHASDRRRARGTRSKAAQERPALDDALADANVTEVRQIELRDVRIPEAPAAGPTSDQPSTIELDVPMHDPGLGCIVLGIADGALTWHLPLTDDDAQPAPKRSDGQHRRVRFRIPCTASRPVPHRTRRKRAIIGAIGRELLKVLVYPITDPILGPIGARFARKWEQRRRPYGVSTLTPETFADSGGTAFTADDWTRIGAGRSLLFLHGTFSTAHGAFATLPSGVLRSLSDHYGGRVFAWNHFTLSDDPRENALRFLQGIPDDVTLDVDIICHSRGGLVARALCEPASDGLDASGKLAVGSVVFVGSPNAGTLLAHPDHVLHMIDRYTTALNVLPTGPVTGILEAIVTTVKILAHATMKSLDGLAAMHPEGRYLRDVNRPAVTTTRYFAISSNFEPDTADAEALRSIITRRIGDAMMDRVFGNAPNDLVVPTRGVYDAAGPNFPIAPEDRLVFPPSRAVWHSAYFEQPETAECLRRWLTMPVDTPLS